MNSRVVNFVLNGTNHMAIVNSTGEFTYENYMDATPKTDSLDECFYFMKEDGSMIPPEIFIPYVNQNFLRQIDDVHIGVINLKTSSEVVENAVSVNEFECINIDKVPTAFIANSETKLSSNNNCEKKPEEILDQLELKDLERFIVDNGGEYLLNRYRENAMLSDPHRKALVGIIVKKLTNEHSFWPSKAHKIKYAKLAVELLPIYKTQSAHNYELFYDPEKQKGYINSRLKTIQKNVRETTGERKQIKRSASTAGESLEEESLSENIDLEVLQIQYKDDIDFLKNCPSSEQSAILERHKKTYLMRKAIIGSKQQFSEIWNIFPSYLTTPNIIQQDYVLCTGCAKTNSKICEFVPNIFSKFSTLKTRKEVKEGVDDEWDSFTNAMLTLLKLLPSYRKRLNKKQKAIEVQVKADNIFNKVIVFVKSNNSVEQSNTNSELPILVAVGPVKKTILQYYIRIDGKLLPTKDNCTSIEAFDCLYKAHTVFNCVYDWELKTFYDFIQYFVYDKKDGIILTTRQKEIWKLLTV